MAMANARERAVDSLMEINEKGRLLSEALEKEYNRLKPLKGEDRALYTRLLEGTLQEMVYIDYCIEQVSSLKIKRMKPYIRNVLRVSSYQLLFMDRVPGYAAVNEAVKLVKRRGMAGLCSFVNGVLRTISDEDFNVTLPDAASDPVGFLSVTYSMPRWIVRMWNDYMGFAVCENMLKSISASDVPVYLWTNERKIKPDKLFEALKKAGVKVEKSKDFPGAMYASNLGDIRKLEAYQKGYFYIQNKSCGIAVRDALEVAGAYLYNSEKPMKMLDVCAAPGGKSLYAANLLGERVRIEARDITERKKQKLDENIARMGYGKIINTSLKDALVLNEDDIGKYDLVFVDAPCSGLGVTGRKPDIRHRVSPDDIEFLAGTQKDMLSVCSKYTVPGGYLVYSTCTVNHFENSDNAKWAAENLDLELLAEREIVPDMSDSGMDGFYYAIFRRNI